MNARTHAALVALLADCHDDPELFFTVVLRVTLRAWQRRLLRRIRRALAAGKRHLQVLVRTCHGAGKTFLVAGVVLWFISTRNFSRGLTTAPGWSSVEGLLWPEISGLYNGSLLRELGYGTMLTTDWTIRDTWYVVGAASDRPERLEGHHSKVAAVRVIDEAKAVADSVYDSTYGMLDAPETLDIWISTPSIEVGKFWDRDINGGPGVIRAVVTIDDLVAEGIPGKAEWREQARKDYGGEHSDTYLARAMAQYVQNAEGALYPSSWLSRARAKDWEPEGDPLVAGQDCAGSRDGDENAYALRWGQGDKDRWTLRIDDEWHWHQADTTVSVGKVLGLARGTKPRKVRTDVQGLGKGMYDLLRQDYPAEAYRAADKANDSTRFVNRKAEDAWHVRELLEQERIRLIVPPLFVEQAKAMRYEVGRDGRIKVIDPADSPDLVDAGLIATSLGITRGGAGFIALAETHLREKAAREQAEAAAKTEAAS